MDVAVDAAVDVAVDAAVDVAVETRAYPDVYLRGRATLQRRSDR